MSDIDPELRLSRLFAKPQRPRDSATLIVVRRDGREPRILLGQRHAAHAFMPGKYVFPGGRLDPHDSRMMALDDLAPETIDRLTRRMRGRPSSARARGIALAAVRETFEETGLILGKLHDGSLRSPGGGWDSFLGAGYGPCLSSLHFFARAITPPGRTRRFDSRFFVVDAENFANLDRPVTPDTDELLTPHWFSFDEARSLDLPQITADILARLRAILDAARWPALSDPVSFQYQSNGRWREDTLV
ncbi:MAG: NUDIX hydrolase [Rhizobiales bacterium]|nr:NUDIX hydrolase [Hyphomicrobiales bacterium]